MKDIDLSMYIDTKNIVNNYKFEYRNYTIDIYMDLKEYRFVSTSKEHLFRLSSGLNGYKTNDDALIAAKELIDIMEIRRQL